MSQHLDTIPIWDAYKQDCECPLCQIRQREEEKYVDNFLGGSVMEPAVRIEVNEKGFCPRHFKQLYDAKNRLGLALMAHTYLKRSIEKLDAQRFDRPSLFSRNKGEGLSAADEVADGCILCERLDNTMWRYALTLCYMWKKEKEFQTAIASSKGFCLPHYAELMRAAQKELSGTSLTEFQRMLKTVQMGNLARIEKEIEWFTLKFDYRNQDKPWGTSADAVERTLNKLRGTTIDKAD